MIKEIIFLLFLYCVLLINFGNLKNYWVFEQQYRDKKNVEFIEIRKENYNCKLKPYTILKNTKEIKDFYKKINASTYSKSAPIPVIEGDNNFFLFLKPKLRKIKNGDIEVENIMSDGVTIYINYKEINNEYVKKKETNPILILKILHKQPKSIKLTQIN
ncbi:hypothetical protein [Chryseobacterium lineare]